MDALVLIVSIVQSFAISLGVGSSTLAIVNFFVAIADGTIDETERRMMGIVYVVLRLAMALILATTVLLVAPVFVEKGVGGLTSLMQGQLVVLFVLYVNALLMTAHLVPSTFGPAIQAGSWYTLGTLLALQGLGLTGFTLAEFTMGYITWIVLAIAIVNGVMAVLKTKRTGNKEQVN